MKRAVFLDRDGTLIEDAGYLDQLDRIRLFPYTIDAVRLLNRAGYAVVIVSNQSGVARGLFDEAFVAAAQNRIAQMLGAGGAAIDAFYFCPHHPEGSVSAYRCACDCRKPKPGLLRQAAADLDLTLDRSFVVGDRAGDVEAGLSVGSPGVLVRTGYGCVQEQRARLAAAAIVDNLMEAVAWILRQP